ncbi:MAG TPA: hypothetical protein VGQ29_04990 [Gemmatimonadales bacterium]|jgi:hypothetical protein|nr:hypothetical protein [Gemmatimonadales bacterium]
MILYRISAGLLLLAALGHTFGGMLGTARRGAKAGAEADQVFAAMKSVRFKWQGAETTWFRFWLGNGLCVSAMFVPAIVALWVLGGLDATQGQATLPIAWAVFAGIALTGALGFKYFGPRAGVGFSVIAILNALAIILSS